MYLKKIFLKIIVFETALCFGLVLFVLTSVAAGNIFL